jgi:membrane fusion protein (multidrug efflux system)
MPRSDHPTDTSGTQAMMQAVTDPVAHQAASPPAATRDVPAAAAAAPQRSRLSLPMIVLAVLGLAAFGVYLYLPSLYEVSTDDAYVDGHVVSVVPKVAAYVAALHVDDNTTFAAGALLVELDPRDFQVAVDTADADLESARANAANVDAQVTEQHSVVAQNEAEIAGDNATLEFARQELHRYGSLAQTGAGTTQQFQHAQSDIGEREAALRRDLAALDAARAHVGVLETARRQAQAAIARAEAALAQARLNLSYTKISAVEDGTVANKNVEVGNFVQPGQLLFSAVPRELYITANYKETQLTNIRPGQAALIRVDAFPALRLYGHVDSIQRDTGAQFALLPPENATGNFVKVVQRVPVKVTFDDPGAALRWISPGMSVEVWIVFGSHPRWLDFLD